MSFWTESTRYKDVRFEDGRKGLRNILGSLVVGSYETGGAAGRVRRAACDEDVLFDGGGEYTKESIVDVLADDVDTAWGTGDVGGRVAEARFVGFGEGAPAVAKKKKRKR